MYSDLYLKPKRNISQYFTAAAVTLGMAAFVFFFYNRSISFTSASKKALVKHEVVNVASHQAGVFWQVDSEDLGWIVYGSEEQNLNQIALDEQDTDSKKNKHTLHYVMINDLKPDSTYYYKIVSDNGLIGDKNNEPFTLRTARNYNYISSLKPAYGKVLEPNGEPAVDAFVLMSYPDSYPFLALTKSSGEWLIPLQFGVDKTDGKMITIAETQPVEIQIFGSNLMSDIKVEVKNASPLPKTIVLGKSYLFTDGTGSVLPASTQRVLSDKSYEVSLLFPKDGSIIPASQPLVRGKGVPGATVVVNINFIPVFTGKAIVDDKGDWRVTVPPNTQPGIYQLIVTTQEANGRSVGFQRRFILSKSGESVLGDATGSATLTPTTAVATSTPVPAVSISPTVTAPSATPTVASTYNPTNTPAPPTSGVNGSLPFVAGGVGMIILGVWLVMLF